MINSELMEGPIWTKLKSLERRLNWKRVWGLVRTNDNSLRGKIRLLSLFLPCLDFDLKLNPARNIEIMKACCQNTNSENNPTAVSICAKEFNEGQTETIDYWTRAAVAVLTCGKLFLIKLSTHVEPSKFRIESSRKESSLN